MAMTLSMLQERVVGGDRLLLPHVQRRARQALVLRARGRAPCSSTTGPREVLMRMAVGFMRRKKASPIRWRVSAFRSVWTET